MYFAQKAPKLALAVAGAALWLTPPSLASDLEVAPIVLELPEEGGAHSLHLVNRGTTPIPVQVEAFAWLQNVDGEALAASEEIKVSPPISRLEPGQEQIVRVLVKPDPGATHERAFRVIVSELPPPDRQNVVRMLLRFSVPVFAGNASAKPKLEWLSERHKDGLQIVVRNSGMKREKLRDLEFIASTSKQNSKHSTRLAYVLAGATRTFMVAGIAPGQTIDIRARDADDRMATQATLVIGR